LLKKGLVDLLSANFLIQILGFGTVLFIPRFVSPAEFGTVKMLQSFTSIFLILAGFGFNTAILKLCAEQRPDEEKAYLLRLSVTRTLFASGIAWFLLALLAHTPILSGRPLLRHWLPIFGLMLPFSAVTMLLGAFLQAQLRIREMARAQLLVKIQSVILIVFSTWLWALKGFIGSTLIAYAAGMWPYLRLTGHSFMMSAPRRVPALFMRMATYSTLANGIHTVGKYADIFVLALFLPDANAIGYYALATIFLLGASVVTSTIQNITLPLLSARSHDAIWFRRQLWRTQWQTTIVSIAVALMMRVIATAIIHLFYNPAYLSTLVYLDVLLLYHVVRSSFAIMGTGLISLGLPQYNFMAACVTTPVGLVLSYGALHFFGIGGVPWARVVTATISLVLLFIGTHLALRRQFPAVGRNPILATYAPTQPRHMI